MNTVTSKDGTTIAFDRIGEGPPVILVCGGSVDRTANARSPRSWPRLHRLQLRPPRTRRQRRHAAVRDRARDRGHRSVIEAAGGSAYLFGSSSGAALALMRRRTGCRSASSRSGSRPSSPMGPPPPADQVEQYRGWWPRAARRRGRVLHDEGRRHAGRVRRAGADPAVVAAQEALAHTLAYDATIMGDYSVPTERAASVKVPPSCSPAARASRDARDRGRWRTRSPTARCASWTVRGTTSPACWPRRSRSSSRDV